MGRRLILACGIGNPGAFEKSVRGQGGMVLEVLAFDDHHEFRPADVDRIRAAAQAAGAEAVLTTSKDWVKLRPLWVDSGVPLYVVQQAVRFEPGHDRQLIDLIVTRIGSGRSRNTTRADRTGQGRATA